MKKIILAVSAIVFVAMLASLASAVDLVAGGNYTFDANTSSQLVYSVVGNSSDLEGLQVYQDGYNITISTSIYFKPDNFTLIFIDNETKEVVREIHHYVSGGGGGASTIYRTIYKYRNITGNVTDEVVVYVQNQTTLPCNQTNQTAGQESEPEQKPNIFVRFWRWILNGIRKIFGKKGV